jgi:caffeoyl-CoA O-methyltransferase
MTPRTAHLSPELHEYLVAHGMGPDELQQKLIEETAALGDPASMQIAPEQGAFLTVLTKLVGTHSAVEVGTFTGYSSIAIARGMAPEGRLVCCDISTEWTSIARKFWELAGVDERIDLRIGPALDTLRALPDEPSIDLSFIDADKSGYISYWEELVPRTRPGGVLLVDNVLWHGEVLSPSTADAHAIVEFNDHVRADDRVDLVMLPIGDGLTMARRK